MKKSEYISIGLAKWILSQIGDSNSFARAGLPKIDVGVFFRELAKSPIFPSSDFSIAISGMGVSAHDLEGIAYENGLKHIRDFTDDWHVAAEWRNNFVQHPRTIALAAGTNTGVHTLSHYARPETMELARCLIEDARENLLQRFPKTPSPHRVLLSTLLEYGELESLLSFESCADFLERWDQYRTEMKAKAPCFALPALGLLVDEYLFQDDIGERLRLNLKTYDQIRTMLPDAIHDLERKKYRNPEKRQQMQEALECFKGHRAAIDKAEESQLTLTMALRLTSPPKDDPKKDKNNDGKVSLTEVSSDALLDECLEDLTAISEAIDEAWKQFEETDNDKELTISVSLPSSEQQLIDKIKVQPELLGWIRTFCTESEWGGVIESAEPSLEEALMRLANHNPVFTTTDNAVTMLGQQISLETLLQAWDNDLNHEIGEKTNISETWATFKNLRSSLLPHLEKLVYHARPWLDGHPDILDLIRQYIVIAGRLYHYVQENYSVMTRFSHDYARSTLEIFLVLDIVQVRLRKKNGNSLSKAVLLPTHPLNLWRNERISSLLRGLAKTLSLSEKDRYVIREGLERQEQFLSVVRLSSLPEGKGLNQLLPVSGRIEGLPVFENLINACSGSDGLKSFREALEQYINLYPNHPYPLRVSIVNPPKPSDIMHEMVGLLNDHRFRSGQKLSGIDVTFYATAQHLDRLRSALSLSNTKDADDIQEKIASNRLLMHVEKVCLTENVDLDGVIKIVRSRPCHVLAIFDESTIKLRQIPGGFNWPMSPFCVRHDVEVDRHSGRIELVPQPGESPFSEFLLLMNELQGTQRDVTPHAYADAKALAEKVDHILQTNPPAARWLFLADRALPIGAEMRSVRVWERPEGMRNTLLATSDFSLLADMIRPAFKRCNFDVTTTAMNRLLIQGAHLIGSGVLEMIRKTDGQAQINKVIGFAGMLLAARDLQKRYPDALVMSVDYPLARMWLKNNLDRTDTRCDLLVLWKDPSTSIFHLDAVEVKSSEGDHIVNERDRLQHAVEQIGITLEAVAEGLEAACRKDDKDKSPLAIPRCEMLKYTLVKAAQIRSNALLSDKKDLSDYVSLETKKRCTWGAWLSELFSCSEEDAPNVIYGGCLVLVNWRRVDPGTFQDYKCESKWPIKAREFGEREIEDLLNWDETDAISGQSSSPAETHGSFCDRGQTSSRACTVEETPSVVNQEVGRPVVIESENYDKPSEKLTKPRIVFAESTSDISDSTTEIDEVWPPPTNAFNMIGQDAVVKQLLRQANYVKDHGGRFPDKLLVGPAGVGKSTVARKIAELLFGQEPIMISGADLKRTEDFLNRLFLAKVVEKSNNAENEPISPCLIFIDEVHGINSQVATYLLSAMDDRRITGLYDFNQVVFLLATTDKGKLTEAFRSRPDQTELEPYSLYEMAGIIWLRAKEKFDGYELSRQSCYEIAARNRCNPRRCVNSLRDDLGPYFNDVARQTQGKVSKKDFVGLMTPENIAKYYEEEKHIDFNGIGTLGMRFLKHLKSYGRCSETRLRQALQLTQPQDFAEEADYLTRLGLIETSTAGRDLTRDGKRYLNTTPTLDLRARISRMTLVRG